MVFTIIVIMGQKGKKLIGLGAECLASLFSWEYQRILPCQQNRCKMGRQKYQVTMGPGLGWQ